MMIDATLLILIGALPALAIPVLFRLKYRFVGIDSWYNLLCARVIRNSGFAYPETIPNFLVAGRYDYPPLLHYLLALVPEKPLHRLHFLINPAIAYANALLCGFFALYLTGSPEAAALAAFICSMTPQMQYESAHLSARMLGSFLLNLAIVSFFMFSYAAMPLWLAASALFFALTLLTHKFAAQAALFMSALLALLYDPAILLSLALGFALALAASFGRYALVLRSHLRALAFHFGHPDYMLKGRYFWIVPDHIVKNAQNPFYLFVLAFPFLFPLAGPGAFLFWWAAVIFAIATVTALKPLKVLGEHYRYLEYSAIPVAIISAKVALSGGILGTLAFAGLGVAAVAITLRLYAIFKKNSPASNFWLVTPEHVVLYSWLAQRKEMRIMSFPDSLEYPMAYFAGKMICTPDSSDAFGWFEKKLPVDRMEPHAVEWAVGEYGIELVVTLADVQLPPLAKFAFKKVHETTNFIIYRVQKK